MEELRVKQPNKLIKVSSAIHHELKCYAAFKSETMQKTVEDLIRLALDTIEKNSEGK